MHNLIGKTKQQKKTNSPSDKEVICDLINLRKNSLKKTVKKLKYDLLNQKINSRKIYLTSYPPIQAILC